MKFGFSLFPMLGYPEAMAPVAKKAEEVGFDSVFSPDHLVFPLQLPATYPYAKDGRSPVQGTDGPRYDAWALLSHLAAVPQSSSWAPTSTSFPCATPSPRRGR